MKSQKHITVRSTTTKHPTTDRVEHGRAAYWQKGRRVALIIDRTERGTFQMGAFHVIQRVALSEAAAVPFTDTHTHCLSVHQKQGRPSFAWKPEMLETSS